MNLASLINKYRLSELTSNSVMIVDDEKENLLVLNMVLRKQFNVITAQSGEEALDLLKSTPCDVLVVDQRMPGLTGVELLERVHALEKDITGIVVTAYAEYRAIMAAINQGGAYKFILKPFDGTQLVAAVNEAMDRTRYARAVRELVNLLDTRVEELDAKNRELRNLQDRLIQSERFNAVGRMTSGIVHEIGNVLSGILFIERELENRDCTQDLKTLFDISVRGLEKLYNTLKDIKLFTKEGSVVGQLHQEYVDCEKLINDAIHLVKLDSTAKQRKIIVQVPGDIPQIFVDPERMIQALINLVRNAVDATKPGQRIWVSAQARDEWIKISVRDEGMGMDESTLEKLFQPLFSTKQDKGMGMGLYMVERVVKAHKGNVSVRSQPGKGTEISVVLPVAKQGDE